MKIFLSLFFAVLFLISFTGLASANLNIKVDVHSVAQNEKPDLYCGLALPPEGEQGGQGEETDAGDETDDNLQGQEDSSGSESDSKSQSDEDSVQN